MCQDRYQPDSCLWEILESTGQTEAAWLSECTAHPSFRIKATVSANKTLAPARRSSWGGEPACSCCSPAGRSTVPSTQRQDQAHIL